MNYKINKRKSFLNISISLLLIFNAGYIQSFDLKWQDMQKEYLSLEEFLAAHGYNTQLENNYYHPHWNNIKNHVRKLILGLPNIHYLKNPFISSTMVRGACQDVIHYEEEYLRNHITDETKQLISLYRESEIGLIPKICKKFNCSANALGQLYYAATILEKSKNLETIIEFGSGYGCLANIFKQILPHATLILIDLPEFLALQFLYLTSSMPYTKVILHKTVPQEYEQNAIHLVHTLFLKDISLIADLFVSTFAISETPRFVQDFIIEKKFFNARYCYIVGQIFKYNQFFEDETILCSAFKRFYNIIIEQQFHIKPAKSYEILGYKK